MTAVLMVARAARRRHGRALFAVALLIGIAGAAVLGAAAGARRTASSLDRFRVESRAGDVELDITSATPEQVAELRRHPAVESLGMLRQVMLAAPDADERGGYLPAAAAVDATFGRDVDRPRVIEGRRARPNHVHEIEVSEVFASLFGLEVGDELELGSYSPAQTELGATGAQVGPPAGPRVRFRVVGIVRRPLDLGISGASGGALVPTPAFHERYKTEIGGYVDALLRVRTRNGEADVPAVIRAARKIFGDELFMVIGVSDETQGVSDAIDVLAAALWIFAAVAALAGATAIGIIVARQLGTMERDQATLVAIGLTARQRVLAAMAVAWPSAVGGSLLAVTLAVLASPLFPFGIARRAEVDFGFQVDARVLILGAVAIIGFTLLVSAFAALSVARSAARGRRAEPVPRPSAVARAATSAGASPALSTGLRMALEPGRGPTAVPVRSALLGTVLGILGITAVLVFAASLDHLAATPRLYGWGWDTTVEPNEPFRPRASGQCGDVDTAVSDDPALSAVASICLEAVEVDGRPATGWFLHDLRGSVSPTIVTGRAPRARDEVALGKATLDAIGKDVGDTVRVRGETTARFRVVGQSVLPHLSDEDTDPIAEGAVFTGDVISELFAPISAPNMYVVARFAGDVDPEQLRRTPDGAWRLESGSGRVPTVPSEIGRLEQVDDLPIILGGLLALLAVVAVAHVVAVAVRRRRHDLAVLRAIGFVRHDVRATIAYQATILGIVGLLVGIPLGVVVGRIAWSVVADGVGVATELDSPLLALGVTALATLVVVNVVGWLGARAVIRDRPATVLATE